MYHFSSGSQQPEAKADRRMFMRRGGRRFSSSSSSAASLPEIAEVAAIPRDEPLVKRSGFGPFAVRIQVANPVPAVPRNILDDNHGAGKLYVAVGEDAEDGKSNLIWAARNFLRAGHPKLVLLHVHRPAHGIMTGLCKVSARQQHEKELKAYRKIGKEESNTPLNQYLDFCRVSFKIQAETLVIEKNSPANGIIELIGQNHITSLVMGTSSFSPQRKTPDSKVAGSVHLEAKPYCQIFYICNETLGCTREATEVFAKVESPQSCVSDQLEFPPRSQSQPGFLSSKDQQALQQRPKSVSYTCPLSEMIADSVENISTTRRWSAEMTPTGFSPNPSQHSTGGSSCFSLNSMDSSLVPVTVASFGEHQHSMVETEGQHEVFEKLQQVRSELQRSRKEASEGQRKTERDSFDASMMFKARENSLRKEKKEVEERLTREKTVLEKEHAHIRNELQKAIEKSVELKNKLLQANFQKDELLREKDQAVRQAAKIRQTNANTVLGSTGTVALTEFSYEEIKEATDNFGDSKKIGQGGCGSVYKGFLRRTIVAIKKINRDGAEGEKEFNDEVEIMCKMRHPNLVTLIGVCREAKALVFEFLSKGSLEDCLQCKNHREPLLWRTRIRIAADICTGLIFLHTNRPKGIAHGDLKPDNVLLDTSFVCKLADFGISRPLNLTNSTVTPYNRTDNLRGTMGYMDPVYMASGELTAQYDVYSFGVVLMRLLTGKSPLGLPREVESALRNDILQDMIDPSAGDWPLECAEELARLALRCCRYDRKERPDLENEVWGVLQAMINCRDDKSQPPTFFICPMTQEIMREPHIAADGFTYEGDAIKDWLERGHEMSPMTYLSFTHRELIPNNALRFAIQEWQVQQQQEQP